MWLDAVQTVLSTETTDYKEEFQGRRRPGRPPKRWTDMIKSDMQTPILTLGMQEIVLDGEMMSTENLQESEFQIMLLS